MSKGAGGTPSAMSGGSQGLGGAAGSLGGRASGGAVNLGGFAGSSSGGVASREAGTGGIMGTGGMIGSGGLMGTGGNGALPAPGAIIDLSSFHLTLPIVNPNGVWALQINQPELNTFILSPYFLVTRGPDGDAILFQTPVDGIKTSNSTKFARTELREDYAGTVNFPDTGNHSWNMNDGRTHTLTIVEKITYLSLKHPAQAMGQIHDPNDDTFMLRAVGNNDGNGQRSTAYSLTAQFDNSSIKKPLTQPGGAALWIPFDTYITLQVIVKSGVCTVNVTYNGQLYSASNSTWATIDPTQNYFKAGNYIQSNVADYAESPGDYSEVVIKALSVTHQ